MLSFDRRMLRKDEYHAAADTSRNRCSSVSGGSGADKLAGHLWRLCTSLLDHAFIASTTRTVLVPMVALLTSERSRRAFCRQSGTAYWRQRRLRPPCRLLVKSCGNRSRRSSGSVGSSRKNVRTFNGGSIDCWSGLRPEMMYLTTPRQLRASVARRAEIDVLLRCE